jgi:hypothetical protein
MPIRTNLMVREEHSCVNVFPSSKRVTRDCQRRDSRETAERPFTDFAIPPARDKYAPRSDAPSDAVSLCLAIGIQHTVHEIHMACVFQLRRSGFF